MVWDAESGKELLTLRGHSTVVYGVAFSPDGKRLATASWDHTAKVWDVESGKELLTLRGHLSGVYGVAFSPDGKRLATASDDYTAKVWDAPSLPRTANAPSSLGPARPCLKFRTLHDQTIRSSPPPTRSCKQILAYDRALRVASKFRYSTIDISRTDRIFRYLS